MTPAHKQPDLVEASEHIIEMIELRRQDGGGDFTGLPIYKNLRSAIAAEREMRAEMSALARLIEPQLGSLGLCNDPNCREPNCARIRPRLAALLARLEKPSP